jgi:hypothetical protein
MLKAFNRGISNLMSRLRMSDTGFSITWVDLHGYMCDLIIICQQVFIVVGRFGKMGNNGDNGREMV